MRFKNLSLAICMMAIGITAAHAGEAKPAKVVWNDICAGGGVSGCIVVDTDGDGEWDRAVFVECNGLIWGHCLGIGCDVDYAEIGHLPTNHLPEWNLTEPAQALNPETGIYAWAVVAYDAIGEFAAITYDGVAGHPITVTAINPRLN